MAEGKFFNVGNSIEVNFGDVISGDHDVYGGRLDGKSVVAVKMVSARLCKWSKRVEGEIAHMIDMGKHENTVSYNASSVVKQPPTIYIAMERCSTTTLDDMVKNGKLPRESYAVVMQHIASGLQHIHEQKITHQVLKPRHILQAKNGKQVKICGFALSKEDAQSQLTISKRHIDEWCAPEIHEGSLTSNKTDVFSAGLIFYFIVRDGSYAFGEDCKAHCSNIRNGKEFIPKLQDIITHLISKMLAQDQTDRPTADQVLEHPYFWDNDKLKECEETVTSFLSSDDLRKLLPNQWSYESNQEGTALLFAVFCWPVSIPGVLSEELLEALQDLRCQPKSRELSDVYFDEGYSEIHGPQFEVNFESDPPRKGIISQAPFLINLNKPLKEGKWVFEAVIQGIVDDHVAVKIFRELEDPEALEIIARDLSGAENVIWTKRNFELLCPTYEAPDDQDAVDLPVTGKSYKCIAMEKCATKSLENLVKQHQSPDYRQMLALHVINAINSLHEKRIVHGRITKDKFVLSEKNWSLKILGSKANTRSEDVKARFSDTIAAADVLDCIMGDPNCPDWDILNDLKEKMRGAKICDQDILRHPTFWESTRKLDFMSDIGDVYDVRDETEDNADFEAHIRDSALTDGEWSKPLKFKTDESEKWFCHPSEGIVFGKAWEEKNKSKKTKKEGKRGPKRDVTQTKRVLKYNHGSPICLLRLIRNCATHLIGDCKAEKEKYTTQQTVFTTRKDIWMFFSKRYPKLFPIIYDYVEDRVKNESKPAWVHRDRFQDYFSETRKKTALNKIKE